VDKWEDNHYAIDSQSGIDTANIIKYIDDNNVPHTCGAGMGPSSGGLSVSLHYAFDPTGWGIQLDLGFTTAPSDCSTVASSKLSRGHVELGSFFDDGGLGGTYNPACDPGTCA